MFSRLNIFKQLRKEPTNIIVGGTQTFNTSGTFDPKYGKQKIFVSGKAQDGTYTPGNANFRTQSGYPNYTYIPADSGADLTISGFSGISQVGIRYTEKFAGAFVSTTNAGMWYGTGSENFTTNYTENRITMNGNVYYSVLISYNPTNDVKQLQIKNDTYNLAYETMNWAYTTIPYDGAGFNSVRGPATISGSTYTWGGYPSMPYSVAVAKDASSSIYFTPGTTSNYSGNNITYLVTGPVQSVAAAGVVKTPWANAGYSVLDGGSNSPTQVIDYYNPGNSTTGSSTNVLGIAIPGGVGTTAPTVPSTIVTNRVSYGTPVTVTVPSGGYVTITYTK